MFPPIYLTELSGKIGSSDKVAAVRSYRDGSVVVLFYVNSLFGSGHYAILDSAHAGVVVDRNPDWLAKHYPEITRDLADNPIPRFAL